MVPSSDPLTASSDEAAAARPGTAGAGAAVDAEAEDAGMPGVLRLLARRYESPQERGRVFERLMQQAFRRHPDVYGPRRFKQVWRWMEWPDRQRYGYGGDIGIDLVAEETEARGGGLCAIQTKAHTSGKINKAAVDSFISASSGEAFSSRLLAVTAPVNLQARQIILKAQPRCEVLYGSDLDSWDVNWEECLDDPSRMRFAPTPRHTPKPYQADAVDSVAAGLAEHDRGRLVLPCGTGKSVVSLWIAEQIAGKGGRVLYLVPSIALMNQTMREWARQQDPDIPHRYVGVCSDVKAGYTGEDAPLSELAMPVTTRPDRISLTLGADDPDHMTVVFCTYQSLGLIAEAQTPGSLFGAAPEFDLVLCDEAHRTTGIEDTKKTSRKKTPSGKGRRAGRAVTPFTFIHDPQQVKARKRLYMTATPRVYTEGVRKRVEQAGRPFDVYSMDDEAVYGPELYRMSFGDAVDGGRLTDYKVLVIAVAENPVLDAYDNIVIDDKHPFKIQEAVRFAGCWDGLADPTTTQAEGRVTGAVNPEHSARRAIAFTNRIRSSQLVERYWGKVTKAISPTVPRPTTATGHDGRDDGGNSDDDGDDIKDDGEAIRLLECEVRHVDGSKNALERADTIAWLREGDPTGGCRIVTNARCLTEGIDVPALDAVIFLEPKQSQVDVIQAVGRVMRKAENKQVGYVILPVVVPSGKSLLDDQVLSGSDFKAVWKVLKALRSHDERLDVKINTADLTGRLPITVLTSGLCDICGRADAQCECTSEEDDAVSVKGRAAQQRLPFEHAIASQLVKTCGDRQYWDRWGKEVARITDTITAHIRTATAADAELAGTFERFAEQMEATVGGSIPSGDLAVMAAQHVVTMPVFEALFAGSGFADRNPVSKALNELIDEFKTREVRLRDETTGLDRFYDSVRNRLSGAADSDARLTIMLEVYESFFKEAMPAEIKRLGIVYTPVELVDFILRSADAVLHREFSRGLSSEGVHILDPFTGTGTFINRLLTQNNTRGEPLISHADLERKFNGTLNPLVPGGGPNEIHANEIVLLAYYLAALKIEEGYRDRTGRYEPFSGIVLTDTFQHDPDKLPGTGTIGYNTARAKQQNKLPIQVIIANPPWSAGQKSAGDDNPNLAYPALKQRVQDTYGKRHREITGRSGGGTSSSNRYVQAIRWASDRLNHPDNDPARPGLIAFVHPNSLSNAPSLVGMRAALRDEFSSIYVVNLLGDAMKSGDEYRREGDKVFGQGSRNGVQITLLVRNPGKKPDQPAELRYATVPEHSTREEKFAWLNSLGDVTSDQLKIVPVNDEHHWVNLTDGTFENLLPLCAVGPPKKRGNTVVTDHALGVKTGCDAYVYPFSYDSLIVKVRDLIDAYEYARKLVVNGTSLEEATANTNLDVIKWHISLKQSLKQNLKIVFDESRIREVFYRPFTKLWLYQDDRILREVKTISKMWPQTDSTDSGACPPPPRGAEVQIANSCGDYSTAPHTNELPRAATTRGVWIHPQQPIQPHTVLHTRRNRSPRPPRLGSSRPDHPTVAIMLSSPSNMAVFGALIATALPDLHLMGPGQATRTIPKHTHPKVR